MKYVLGIVLIIAGFVITWKSDWLMNNFGRIAWAEEKLGMEGGTRLFYKLIGVTVIVFAFLYMTGAVQVMVGWVFKPTVKTLSE